MIEFVIVNKYPKIQMGTQVKIGLAALKQIIRTGEINSVVKSKCFVQSETSLLYGYHFITTNIGTLPVYAEDFFLKDNVPDFIYEPKGLPLKQRVNIFEEYYINRQVPVGLDVY